MKSSIPKLLRTTPPKHMPMFPIYIPSKGRANNLRTGRMFDRDGVPYKVVVEPSQVEAYTAAGYGDRLLVLPENGRGLVYSRRWITDYSRERGEERHWQIDDDIDDIWRLYKGYRLRCESAVAIRASEDFAERYENVALLSLNSLFFIPISRGGFRKANFPPFYLNHRCYTMILFLNSLPYQWRYPNNEDADMTLQVLAGGWCTLLINAFLIDTETTMTAAGGQTESFIAGARLAMVRSLERKWPGVVTVNRRFGHPQHMIKDSWRRFDTPLKPKPGFDRTKLPKTNEYGMKVKALGPVESHRLRDLVTQSEHAPDVTELPGSEERMPESFPVPAPDLAGDQQPGNG